MDAIIGIMVVALVEATILIFINSRRRGNCQGNWIPPSLNSICVPWNHSERCKVGIDQVDCIDLMTPFAAFHPLYVQPEVVRAGWRVRYCCSCLIYPFVLFGRRYPLHYGCRSMVEPKIHSGYLASSTQYHRQSGSLQGDPPSLATSSCYHFPFWRIQLLCWSIRFSYRKVHPYPRQLMTLCRSSRATFLRHCFEQLILCRTLPKNRRSWRQTLKPSHGTFFQCECKKMTFDGSFHATVVEDGLHI